MVGERDKVATRALFSGTNQGEFQGTRRREGGFAPTSWTFSASRTGKAVERWGVVDVLSMLQQLGVMPHDGGG